VTDYFSLSLIVNTILPRIAIWEPLETPLDCLQQPLPKIQDSFHVWVALQTNDLIHIFGLLQQPDPKENPFCKWVFRREDVTPWCYELA
jgi:hypothetical protein